SPSPRGHRAEEYGLVPGEEGRLIERLGRGRATEVLGRPPVRGRVCGVAASVIANSTVLGLKPQGFPARPAPLARGASCSRRPVQAYGRGDAPCWIVVPPRGETAQHRAKPCPLISE